MSGIEKVLSLAHPSHVQWDSFEHTEIAEKMIIAFDLIERDQQSGQAPIAWQ